jgi:hypothetical protein
MLPRGGTDALLDELLQLDDDAGGAGGGAWPLEELLLSAGHAGGGGGGVDEAEEAYTRRGDALPSALLLGCGAGCGGDAGGGWRCLNAEHAAGCEECTPPPSVAREATVVLSGGGAAAAAGGADADGGPGGARGLKALRTALLLTPEWNSAAARDAAAAALDARGRGGADEAAPGLAAALRAKASRALTKGHLIALCRLWRYKSDVWCVRSARVITPAHTLRLRLGLLPRPSHTYVCMYACVGALTRSASPPPRVQAAEGQRAAQARAARRGAVRRRRQRRRRRAALRRNRVVARAAAAARAGARAALRGGRRAAAGVRAAGAAAGALRRGHRGAQRAR